jgi:hypothetical protein
LKGEERRGMSLAWITMGKSDSSGYVSASSFAIGPAPVIVALVMVRDTGGSHDIPRFMESSEKIRGMGLGELDSVVVRESS